MDVEGNLLCAQPPGGFILRPNRAWRRTEGKDRGLAVETGPEVPMHRRAGRKI